MPDTCIDYDVHGIVGIRLLNPSPSDAVAVARQLGPLQRPLTREPDLTIRFVSELPLSNLQYVTLPKNGFTDDGFFLLQSKKHAAKVRVPFEDLGNPCEMVCESGLHAIPLLLAIVNLTLLKKGYVSLHASAFVYQDRGILVTGWAKGGKTEALLAFARHGARYVGDEWVIVSGDGQRMYGIPQPLRLWDWHLAYLPQARRLMTRQEQLLFNGIHLLDYLQQTLSRSKIGHAFPIKLWHRAMPALKRQLNTTVAPQALFGAACGTCIAKPETIFLLMNHEAPEIRVTPTDTGDLTQRMLVSLQYELLPFMEHYMAYRFAYPNAINPFIEQAHVEQAAVLSRALAGKEAYTVWHPHPFSLPDLYEQMHPYCPAPLPAAHVR